MNFPAFQPFEAPRKQHEFCSPPPPLALDASGTLPREGAEPPPDRPRRKALWALRDSMRQFQGPKREDRKGGWQAPRPVKCGWTLCGVPSVDGVQARERLVEVRHGEHGASFRGLVVCASVWACPVCSAAIRGERSAEVQKAVEVWGQPRVVLLSLTVRHGMGDDVRGLARGVANAWRRMTRGAPWKRLARRLGIRHSIRALELTHGAHGWHPHLHVLLFLARPSKGGDVSWRLSEDRAQAHLAIARLWRKAVARELGPDHEPDDVHGTDVRPCHRADYISKLGLEVTDPGLAKRGRSGRSPWQIASDLASYQGDGAQTIARRERDASLWLAYVEGTRGRKMLTWSKGLKRVAGIAERDDAETLEKKERPQPIAYLNLPTWRELRRTEGGREKLLAIVEGAAKNCDLDAKPLDAWRTLWSPGQIVTGEPPPLPWEPMTRALTDWLHQTGVWRPPPEEIAWRHDPASTA